MRRRPDPRSLGFTITEILIAFVLTAALAGLGVNFMLQNTNDSHGLATQALLDSSHALGLRAARSPDAIKATLLVGNSAARTSSEAGGNTLTDCLSGKGSNCSALDQSFVPLTTVNGTPGEYNGTFSLDSGVACTVAGDPLCTIVRRTVVKPICRTNSACQEVEVQVTSEYRPTTATSLKLQDRTDTFRFSGAQLVAKGAIDFSCSMNGARKLATAVNWQEREGTCTTPKITQNCDAANPVTFRGFGLNDAVSDCQPTVNDTCPANSGFGSAGFFPSQTNCPACGTACDVPCVGHWTCVGAQSEMYTLDSGPTSCSPTTGDVQANPTCPAPNTPAVFKVSYNETILSSDNVSSLDNGTVNFKSTVTISFDRANPQPVNANLTAGIRTVVTTTIQNPTCIEKIRTTDNVPTLMATLNADGATITTSLSGGYLGSGPPTSSLNGNVNLGGGYCSP